MCCRRGQGVFRPTWEEGGGVFPNSFVLGKREQVMVIKVADNECKGVYVCVRERHTES